MADKETKDGKSAVVVSIAGAARELARQKRRLDDPLPHLARGPKKDVPPNWPNKPPNWTADRLGLPAEDPCPVVVLGVEGDVVHMIDTTQQFRSLKQGDFNHARMQGLFAAAPNWPQWAFPRHGRAPKAAEEGAKPKMPPIKSFDDDALREALFRAAARRGIFSPADKLRGRGAWLSRGGDLLYHAGEELWRFDQVRGRPIAVETGEHEGFLYARMPGLPAPWTEPIRAAESPVAELIRGFRKWNWERPAIDPVLLLGWIGVAFLGGALRWRSAVFMVGDRETGKSTLQHVLWELFGEALFHSGDTTAPGISQDLGRDTRPVALDELEAEADSRRANDVVRLARAASSGDFRTRGSSGGEAMKYQMRSAFIFSAINMPPLFPQDLSRLAVLRLRKIPAGAPTEAPLTIDADRCGPMILATLLREWHRFEETLAAYRGALAAGGHSGRGQDTYGTLLACADLLISSEIATELDISLTDDLDFWTKALAADALPEVEDAVSNWRGVIIHLLTAQVEPWRNGARQTVGKVLADIGKGDYTAQDAENDLEKTGLGLIRADVLISRMAKTHGMSEPAAAAELGLDRNDGWLLVVPNQSSQVAKLYAGTRWAGVPGAGVWKDAMRQAPGVVRDDGDVKAIVISDKRINRIHVQGVQQRCTLIVMTRFHGAAER